MVELFVEGIHVRISLLNLYNIELVFKIILAK